MRIMIAKFHGGHWTVDVCDSHSVI